MAPTPMRRSERLYFEFEEPIPRSHVVEFQRENFILLNTF